MNCTFCGKEIKEDGIIDSLIDSLRKETFCNIECYANHFTNYCITEGYIE